MLTQDTGIESLSPISPTNANTGDNDRPRLKSFRYSVNTSGTNKTWDMYQLTNRFEDTTGTLDDVVQAVQAGHAICSGLLGGRSRAKHNVIGSDWVLLDVDNSKAFKIDGKSVQDESLVPEGSVYRFNEKGNIILRDNSLTLEDAAIDPFVVDHCALIYTTASHTEDWHKFRMIFLSPQQMHSVATIEATVHLLMERFPHDPSCKDAGRVFFGNTDARIHLYNPYTTLPDDWIELANKRAAEKEAQMKLRQLEAEANRKKWENIDPADTEEQVYLALSHIPTRDPGSNNYSEWTSVLMALHSHFGAVKGEQIARQWDSTTEGTKWDIGRKMKSYRGKGVGIGSLFAIAKQYGYQPPKRQPPNKQVEPQEMGDAQAKAEGKRSQSFAEVMELFEAHISQFEDDLEIEWEADSFVLEHGLGKRRLTGEKLLTKLQATKDKAERKEPEDAVDIATEQGIPSQWIMPGLLQLGTTILLSAQGGCGKTTWVYDLMKSIGMGKPWSGKRVNRYKCLMVQADEPRVNVRQKLKAQLYRHLERGWIGFLDDWKFTKMDQLEEAIVKHGYKFIALDSWTACHAGTDTDLIASTAVNNVYKLRDLAQKYNCTFLILHHLNAKGTSRDSTAVPDGVSEVMTMRKPEPKDDLSFRHRILEIHKSRGDIEGKYLLEQEEIDYSWVWRGRMSDEDVVLKKACGDVTQILEQHLGTPFTAAQLEKCLHGTRKVSFACESLTRKGYCDSFIPEEINGEPNLNEEEAFFIPDTAGLIQF